MSTDKTDYRKYKLANSQIFRAGNLTRPFLPLALSLVKTQISSQLALVVCPKESRTIFFTPIFVSAQFLAFNCDYITLNLFRDDDPLILKGVAESKGKCYTYNHKTLDFLMDLFSKPHNYSNANTYNDVKFMDFDINFTVQYIDGPAGVSAQFWFDKQPMFQIVRNVRNKHTGNISKYLFTIDFYAQFFNFQRIHKLESYDLLKYFQPYWHSIATKSIGRVDMALDIAGYTPEDIMAGYESSLDINVSRLNETSSTTETIYIGKNKIRNKKVVRMYDKLVDTLAKNKRQYFADYFEYDKVTRFELELHWEYLKKYQFEYLFFFDRVKMFNIFYDCLNDRFTNYAVIDEFMLDMKKKGITVDDLPKNSVRTSDRQSTQWYIDRFVKQAIFIRDQLQIDPVGVLFATRKYDFKSPMPEDPAKYERLKHLFNVVFQPVDDKLGDSAIVKKDDLPLNITDHVYGEVDPKTGEI